MISHTGFVSETLEDALSSRLLGSGDFDTGFKPLDTALTLQFRLHYHLLGNGVSVAVGQVLQDECLKLEANLKELHFRSLDNNVKSIIKKILYNVRGLICYHMDAINEAKELLGASSSISINQKDFAKSLDLENLYYRGLCSKDTVIYVKEVFEILDEIPMDSHGITWHYLERIFKSLTKEQLKSLPSNNVLTLLAYQITGSSDEKELLARIEPLLKESKFPHATEPNNNNLIQFHLFLQYFFRDHPKLSSKWNSFIVQSIERTFQSREVAKSAMMYFSKGSNSGVRESVLNFVNFIRYAERDFIINNRKYDDIISLIDCYTFILNVVKNKSFDIENVFNLDECVDRLLSLLQSFYRENNFSLMNEVGSLNWLENSSRLILPNRISGTLSNAWKVLYQHRQKALDCLLSNKLTSYLSNAMCVESNTENLCELQFQYAYLLAEKRLIPTATKILKTVLLEKNPELYKAWHLLALCESIREDKEAAFKIICSVLEAMKESFIENKLSKGDRWQFVQLKMTQLSLIEEIFGTLDSLEMLPEVFELYTDLFPEESKEFDSFGPEINQSKEYLLQMVWIFAANMYLRSEEKSDSCKNAIKEAENVTDSYKNLNCNLAKGYMYLKENNLKRAMKEFETVLFYDQYNVNAILGFAEIVFPDDGNESRSSLQKYYDLVPVAKPSAAPEVFVNDLDDSAASARLKFLLEYSITQSSEAYHSPEIWWYLSLIYSKFGDKNYQDSLLNCIRYEETMPIREFQYCNY